ncbi:MAG: hypothetical protein LIP77_10650 [Planctomycetes bacterium]|nr:hypothetical protein [Planctomycetota bacterium]
MITTKCIRPFLAAAMLVALGIGVASAFDTCNPCATPAPVEYTPAPVVEYVPAPAPVVAPCNPCVEPPRRVCNPCKRVKPVKMVCKTDRCGRTYYAPKRGFRMFGWFRSEPSYDYGYGYRGYETGYRGYYNGGHRGYRHHRY